MQRHPLLHAMHRESVTMTDSSDRILAELMHEVGEGAFPPLADFSAFGRLVEPEPVRPRTRRPGQRHITMSRDPDGHLHAEVHTDDGARRTVHMRRAEDGSIVADVEDE